MHGGEDTRRLFSKFSPLVDMGSSLKYYCVSTRNFLRTQRGSTMTCKYDSEYTASASSTFRQQGTHTTFVMCPCTEGPLSLRNPGVCHSSKWLILTAWLQPQECQSLLAARAFMLPEPPTDPLHKQANRNLMFTRGDNDEVWLIEKFELKLKLFLHCTGILFPVLLILQRGRELLIA